MASSQITILNNQPKPQQIYYLIGSYNYLVIAVVFTPILVPLLRTCNNNNVHVGKENPFRNNNKKTLSINIISPKKYF